MNNQNELKFNAWPTKSELRCAYYGRNKLAE
jgi:hypothetical protein